MLKYTITLTCALLVGCNANAPKSGESSRVIVKNVEKQLARSLHTWSTLRDKHHGNYSYDRNVSTWRGQANSTKIVVENNRVESRYFFEWQQSSSPTLIWAESFMELGLHNEGAPAKTIDQLYQQCKDDILSKPEDKFKVTVVLDRFNLLQQCSYREFACFDDCTKGIKIDDLEIH